MKAPAESQDRYKAKGFNTKGYFHMIQPYCQQYIKAKHESYEKTRRLRESKSKDKQNNPTMFELKKPKAGFYLLKGCKAQPLSTINEDNMKNVKDSINTGLVADPIKGKSQFLSQFIKKYNQRKEKMQKRQMSENLLPAVKFQQPVLYPLKSTNQEYTQSNHSRSIGLEFCAMNSHLRLNTKKLRTEPIDKRKNKSCRQLEKRQKVSLTELSSLTNLHS